MAASGNKDTSFSGSMSIGSAEDFDRSCDPCLTAGQHVEAHGFCVDCQEYLCKTCFTVHQRTRASRHHQLLTKYKIDQHGVPISHSNLCTEKCSVHTDELIKYFCPQHKKLGCHDCVILEHRDCTLDYIPEKCGGIGDSEEYRRAVWLLDMKMKAIRSVEKKAIDRKKDIDTCHRDLINEIDQFEKKIISYIRQRRNEFQAEMDTKKSRDTQKVQDVLDSCSKASSEISKQQSNLKDSKTRKQNSQTYIEIKRAMSILTSDEVKEVEEILANTNMQYIFNPNQDLQKMLSQQSSFGKLSLSASLVSPIKKLDTLSRKYSINVRTKTDKKEVSITGCTVLSSNKLALADTENEKIKIIDLNCKRVITEKELDSSPFAITTLPNDQIAVTLPDKSEVLMMQSDSKLSPVDTFQVKGRCLGICYHRDYLYVACDNPNSVVILDTKGNVCNTIHLNDDDVPVYIAVNEDSGLIYFSNASIIRYMSLAREGEMLAETNDLLLPQGMAMLPGGSMLVCCYLNDTLYHVTGDLQQHRQVIDGLKNPQSLCYNRRLEEVYIGGHNCDQLVAFSVKYHN